MKTICDRQLKPIYMQTIISMIILEGVGLNYNDNLLMEKVVNAVHLKWLKLVFLCELVHIVEDIEGLNWNGRSERFIKVNGEIKVLDEKRAAEVMGEQQLKEDEYDQIRQINFKPILMVTIGETIYNDRDKKLVSSIDSFDTSISDSSRRLDKMPRRCEEADLWSA